MQCMKRIDIDFSNPTLPPKKCAVTFGCFDGIHLGHQEVIRQLKKEALKRGIKAALYLFHPHPQTVLTPQSNFKKLFTLQETEALLHSMGLDFFGLVPFNLKVSKWSPKEFIKSFLIPHLNPRLWVVGYDFAFGAGRVGKASHLKTLAKELSFEVQQLPPVLKAGEPVSTSRIKKLIVGGAIKQANELLGREFFFSGNVVKGEGRGKKIGYPTANLLLDANKIVLKKGVYGVQVQFQEKWHPGVMNVGFRPTFFQELNSREKTSDTKKLHFEVHVIGGSFELYGKQIRVQAQNFLREERAFDSENHLKSQIQRDIQKTLKYLSLPGR